LFPTSGPIQFICDVFTRGFTAEVEAREDSYDDISNRLKTIERPYDLVLRADDALLSTTEIERAEMVEAVDRWLSLQPTSAFEWRGIGIAILGKRSAGPVSISIEEPMHLVQTPRSIRRNVVEKTRKYGNLSIPFVVAAVKDPRSDVKYLDFFFGSTAQSYFSGGAKQTRPRYLNTVCPVFRSTSPMFSMSPVAPLNLPVPPTICMG
jgi:hypothetical protein